MVQAMKVHHEKVRCRMQALWCNVMSEHVWYCGESSLYILTGHRSTIYRVFHDFRA